eukprot:1152272-Pelagomonas_calceolata.AAC.16
MEGDLKLNHSSGASTESMNSTAHMYGTGREAILEMEQNERAHGCTHDETSRQAAQSVNLIKDAATLAHITNACRATLGACHASQHSSLQHTPSLL